MASRRPATQTIPAGETGTAGAEGATAPETLRHPDRRGMNLWKAGAREARLTEGVSRAGAPARESLRSDDRGGSHHIGDGG